MSEADKVIGSLVIAFVLIMVVFATLVIGSNNPSVGPSIPAYERLIYTVNGKKVIFHLYRIYEL